ncbi:MAG: hypothetical protein A3J51_03925 [Omnitrophica WOR_2 bacterium RIFCSPHIGHO2_02_FULL_45_21]|nr:MAG: hypothetical protein A3J51_03925 [Omnitrophica WOR_2 bacterium RIFCSPHIGHO2_02_FULL_45_21]
MLGDKIKIEDFHALYIQTTGEEGARKITKEAIAEAGLVEKKEYSKEEALKICEALKKKSGFIKTLANLFSVRIRLHGITKI